MNLKVESKMELMKVYWIYTPNQNLRSYIWTSKVKF
jgi:hypothetical protein